MQVFVFVRKPGAEQWEMGTYHDFASIPKVGEYFTLEGAEPWHVVKAVIHTPWSPTQAAELYAQEVDHMQEMKGF